MGGKVDLCFWSSIFFIWFPSLESWLHIIFSWQSVSDLVQHKTSQQHSYKLKLNYSLQIYHKLITDYSVSAPQRGRRPPPWSSIARMETSGRCLREGPRRLLQMTSTRPSAPHWPGSWFWLSSLRGLVFSSSCLIWWTTRPFQVRRGVWCTLSPLSVWNRCVFTHMLRKSYKEICFF